MTDGFPRAIERTLANLRGSVAPETVTRVGRVYWGSMIALPLIAIFIILGFSGSLTAMVDFATIVAFLTAPILGYFNLRAVTSSAVPAGAPPGPPHGRPHLGGPRPPRRDRRRLPRVAAPVSLP